MRNRLTLEQIRNMPVGDIAALSAEELLLLTEEAEEQHAKAKRVKEWLENIIAIKYGERAGTARAAAGKDTGVVHFEDDGIDVAADLPKKAEWDQKQLAAIVERIIAGGDNPAEYVQVSYKVTEEKYKAWPQSIRQVFESARTVKTGKPSFTLTRRKEA